jgi:hypothetical protein
MVHKTLANWIYLIYIPPTARVSSLAGHSKGIAGGPINIKLNRHIAQAPGEVLKTCIPPTASLDLSGGITERPFDYNSVTNLQESAPTDFHATDEEKHSKQTGLLAQREE